MSRSRPPHPPESRRQMVELWQAGYAATAVRRGEGAELEAAGWDGKMAMDSQSLAADGSSVAR